MRASAAAQFFEDMKVLEGVLNHLYFDTKNLATTGTGNMIDTGTKLTTYGLVLPWRKKDGSYATESEAAAEYSRLKALGIASKGGYAYKKYASLFLDDSVIEWMFEAKRDDMESDVRGFIAGWDDLRADAQAAAMSMVWNVGQNMFNPSSKSYWPNLSAALKAKDYIKASDNCAVNGTTSERNRRNRKMFFQAARAELFGSDPDICFGTTLKISAANIPNGNPVKPGSHAFFTQCLLRAAGTYTSKVDGLFGNISLTAWTKVTGETAINLKGLQKLVELTKYTVGAEAVG